MTTGNALVLLWPGSELIDADAPVEVEDDFLGGMTGLLGGTGGGTPLWPTFIVFLGVVGWTVPTVADVGVADAEGRVALVVTWNVTLPSLLVVVKTLVPAEAETATRGEDDAGTRPL